jgi:hypothetical protein
MRSLETSVKVNFIKNNKIARSSRQSGVSLASGNSSRPGTGFNPEGEVPWPVSNASETTTQEEGSPKKARPRSLTFTLKRGDGKEKADRPAGHTRTKSEGLVHSASSTSLNGGSASLVPGFFNKAPKPALPEDFITYLRKVQQPQLVEVGRLQKLRQLLRNETVTWVDAFVTQGGVTEVVCLLYRIIDIEWRYVSPESPNGMSQLTNTPEKSMRTLSSTTLLPVSKPSSPPPSR